jgi:hypothetical protein
MPRLYPTYKPRSHDTTSCDNNIIQTNIIQTIILYKQLEYKENFGIWIATSFAHNKLIEMRISQEIARSIMVVEKG